MKYPGVLYRYRDMVAERLKVLITENPVYDMLSYHLGFKDEEGRRVVVRTRQNWESAMLGKGHSEPQCHFTRGFFTGFISGLFNEEFASREAKCECMGDEYCEFVFEVGE